MVLQKGDEEKMEEEKMFGERYRHYREGSPDEIRIGYKKTRGGADRGYGRMATVMSIILWIVLVLVWIAGYLVGGR